MGNAEYMGTHGDKISTSEQHHFSHILTFHILWLAATARTVAPATAMAAATARVAGDEQDRSRGGRPLSGLPFDGSYGGPEDSFERRIPEARWSKMNLRVDYILNRTQYIISITGISLTKK